MANCISRWFNLWGFKLVKETVFIARESEHAEELDRVGSLRVKVFILSCNHEGETLIRSLDSDSEIQER